MAFTVRCPAAACRKFMLAEPADRGKSVPCLICKTPIPVPAAPPPATPVSGPATDGDDLQPVFE